MGHQALYGCKDVLALEEKWTLIITNMEEGECLLGAKNGRLQGRKPSRGHIRVSMEYVIPEKALEGWTGFCRMG